MLERELRTAYANPARWRNRMERSIRSQWNSAYGTKIRQWRDSADFA
jgi:hypothetical protein